MKKVITAVLSLVYLQVCHAETASVTETIAYEDTVAGSGIFMTLSETDGGIVGGYHYKKYGTAIPLRGSIVNSHITLIEKSTLGEAKISAELENQLRIGTWKGNGISHSIHASALSKSYTNLINGIDISKNHPNTNIKIRFIDGRSQKLEVETLTDTTSIVFEDYNFDGFPDLRVLESSTNSNTSYIAWTYEPSKKVFEYSEEISMLSSPKVLHSERAILSLSRDGCCRYIATKSTGTEKRYAEFEYEKLMGGRARNRC